jgi:hypothetical protein
MMEVGRRDTLGVSDPPIHESLNNDALQMDVKAH